MPQNLLSRPREWFMQQICHFYFLNIFVPKAKTRKTIEGKSR